MPVLGMQKINKLPALCVKSLVLALKWAAWGTAAPIWYGLCRMGSLLSGFSQ